MWEDPIVKEVRDAGAKLAQKCDYDFYKFSQMIKEHQKRSKMKTVSKKEIKKDNLIKT